MYIERLVVCDLHGPFRRMQSQIKILPSLSACLIIRLFLVHRSCRATLSSLERLSIWGDGLCCIHVEDMCDCGCCYCPK